MTYLPSGLKSQVGRRVVSLTGIHFTNQMTPMTPMTMNCDNPLIYICVTDFFAACLFEGVCVMKGSLQPTRPRLGGGRAMRGTWDLHQTSRFGSPEVTRLRGRRVEILLSGRVKYLCAIRVIMNHAYSKHALVYFYLYRYNGNKNYSNNFIIVPRSHIDLHPGIVSIAIISIASYYCSQILI